jgi:hypothetical protein
MSHAARRLRAALAVALLVVAVGIAACGGGTQKTPLGTVSQHDLSTLNSVSADMRQFTAAYTNLVKSLNAEDVPGSRKAITGMHKAVGKATDQATSIDARQQRTTMQRYLAKMRGVTTAADRLIAYIEKTPKPKAAVANGLAMKFRQAANAAHQADLSFMRNMLKHATPEQRKKLQAAFNRANQKYNQAVGSGGG